MKNLEMIKANHILTVKDVLEILKRPKLKIYAFININEDETILLKVVKNDFLEELKFRDNDEVTNFVYLHDKNELRL